MKTTAVHITFMWRFNKISYKVSLQHYHCSDDKKQQKATKVFALFIISWIISTYNSEANVTWYTKILIKTQNLQCFYAYNFKMFDWKYRIFLIESKVESKILRFSFEILGFLKENDRSIVFHTFWSKLDCWIKHTEFICKVFEKFLKLFLMKNISFRYIYHILIFCSSPFLKIGRKQKSILQT